MICYTLMLDWSNYLTNKRISTLLNNISLKKCNSYYHNQNPLNWWWITLQILKSNRKIYQELLIRVRNPNNTSLLIFAIVLKKKKYRGLFRPRYLLKLKNKRLNKKKISRTCWRNLNKPLKNTKNGYKSNYKIKEIR